MRRLGERVVLLVVAAVVVLAAADLPRPRGARRDHNDAPIVPATDDLDTRGRGLPVPPAQAVAELRVERRFETVVFVRAVLIFVAIAALLTARAIFV